MSAFNTPETLKASEVYEAAYLGKRLLITGAGGFLGQALLSRLGNIPCEITAISRRLKSFHSPEAQIQFFEPDYGSRDFWKKVLPGTDFIFHFAAQTSVSKAEENPLEDFRMNVLPLLILLQVCEEMELKPAILFAGTATQVGLVPLLPVDESVPSQPLTLYDLHKQMAEDYLKFFVRRRLVRGLSLRLPNLYGPGQEVISQDRGILNRMIARAMRGEPLTLLGEGQAVRDYLFHEDAVAAFLAAGAKIEELNGGHFIVGSGKGISLQKVFQLVLERVEIKLGIKGSLEQKAEAILSPIETRNYVADIGLFSELSGWQPKISLQEGIDACIKFWQEKKG